MAGASAAQAASATPGRLVHLPDGRRLLLRCSGKGPPTVLLEAGFGASSLAWAKVQPLVASTNHVCSYDRAGSGLSDPGPFPRDGAAIARDLDQALVAARIGGPFIVVGHSAGALFARTFANRHPRKVAGLVLADPSVEQQEQRFVQAFGPGAGSTAGLRKRELQCIRSPGKPAEIMACRTRLSELENLWTGASRKLNAAPKSYGALPLIVLTAEGTYQGRAAAFWFALHDEITARSTNGRHYLVAGSSHMMIRDRPDAIAGAIHEVARGHIGVASAPAAP